MKTVLAMKLPPVEIIIYRRRVHLVINEEQIIDLKQVVCQLFLQQRWVDLDSEENCILRSANFVSHVQVPPWQGKKNAFLEKKGKSGGL